MRSPMPSSTPRPRSTSSWPMAGPGRCGARSSVCPSRRLRSRGHSPPWPTPWRPWTTALTAMSPSSRCSGTTPRTATPPWPSAGACSGRRWRLAWTCAPPSLWSTDRRADDFPPRRTLFPAGPPGRVGAMSPPVLLAVDDDGPVLAAIERDLRERYSEHYRVMASSSGEQALELLRRLRLREEAGGLMLVDQRMPGMSGTELLTASRQLYPDARRVLLTAYADTDAAIRAINDAEVHHYMLKPWDPPEERLYPVLDDLLETWRRPLPAANLRLIGDRWSTASHELREFLARNLVPYRWLDVESDPQARVLLDLAQVDAGSLPALVLDDGEVLVTPDLHEVAQRIGLQVRAG